MNDELQKLSQEIEEMFKNISHSIPWVEKFLSAEKKNKAYSELVNLRRMLKKLKHALFQNPSAVLYGESQVGKSYLIKNLLSTPEGEFSVMDEATKKSYKFIEQINPRGGGIEATSVVTRFSTNVDIIDVQFPIKINLLSPRDVTLFLLDSTLSELKGLKFLRKDEIVQEIEALEDKYRVASKRQEFLSEDDIIDIEEYLNKYHPQAAVTIDLNDSGFWSRVSRVIEKVESNNWSEAVGIFWGRNEYLTKTFDRLISALENLDFQTVGYCKFEAVLRDHGTLLDVKRLHMFKEDSNQKATKEDAEEGYIPNVEVLIGPDKTVRLDKSELCALTGELVFKLDKELEHKKEFLKQLDLLDFPGARARKEIMVDSISEDVSNIILRGKVAYIFNKYSTSFLISNLLFCNKIGNFEANYIPRLLNDWINEYIGESPEEREEALDRLKVAPLFIIHTWYNDNLSYDSANDKSFRSLSNKWTQRFNGFSNEIVTQNYNWDKKWTVSQPCFQNQYMLRDLRLSEEKSHLYEGFAEDKEEKKRNEFSAYKGENPYWEDLKSSFVNHEYVRNHFENPELMWKESSTKNQDGTAPILRNLVAASGNEREVKFKKELNTLKARLLKELRKHYHDEASGRQLADAVKKAGNIQLDMDIAIDRDPYFFGKLIQKLLIKEGEIFNFYRDQLRNIELVEHTDISGYFTILYNNPDLIIVPNKEDWKPEYYDRNLEILQKSYSKQSKEEVEEQFKEKRIDLMELFIGAASNIKSHSKVLAESLADHWFEKYLVPERLEEFAELGLKQESSEDLIDNIKANFKKVGLVGSIAESIRKYVDRYDKIDKVQQMIADISAAKINKFVNSMGHDYYADEEIKSLQKASIENDLGFSLEENGGGFKSMDRDALEELFDILDNLDDLINRRPIDKDVIKNVPSYSQYFKWRKLLKVSFTACCDIPTYDIMANNELKAILDEINHEGT